MEEDNSVETFYLDSPVEEAHSTIEDDNQPGPSSSRGRPQAFEIYSEDDSDAYSLVTDSDGEESVSTPSVRKKATDSTPWDTLTKDSVDEFLNPYLETLSDNFLKAKRKTWSMLVGKREEVKGYRKLLLVEEVIEHFGLCDNHFEVLLNIFLRARQAKMWKKRFLCLLLPRRKLPFHLFMTAVSFIGRFDDHDLDHDFVGWLIGVYSLIDDKEKASKLYGAVFFHLKRSDVRDNLCHLLYYMTQANHIRKQRTNYLLKLFETDKDNTNLIALLLTYKQFDRNISIPVNIRMKTGHVFTSPMPLFEQKLYAVQQLWNNRVDPIRYRQEVLVTKTNYALKRRKGEGLTINQITKPVNTLFLDATDIIKKAKNLEKLQVGELVNTVVDNNVLQLIITINPESSVVQRATSFIAQDLFGGLQTISDPARRRDELKQQFKDLLTFSRFTKRQLPSVDYFLRGYIKNWNGYEFVDEIFELITYMNPLDYDGFLDDILKPLYRLFCVSKVTWKASLIKCYADLLKNWVMRDWKEFLIRRQNPTRDDIEQITNLFDQLLLDVDYFHTIRELIHFTDQISVLGLVLENDNPTIQHACLSFFEVASSIFTEHDFPEIIIPSPTFVYRLFLSKNALAVSRICNIVSQFKNAFEQNEKKQDDGYFETAAEQMAEFNGYLTDVCNALWMNKAFAETEGGNLRFQLSDDLIKQFDEICIERDEKLNQIASLIQSPASSGFTKRFVAEIERNDDIPVHLDKPVTPDSLREIAENGGMSFSYFEFKRRYLDYLFDIGFTGYRELLYCSMASLRRAKDLTIADA